MLKEKACIGFNSLEQLLNQIWLNSTMLVYVGVARTISCDGVMLALKKTIEVMSFYSIMSETRKPEQEKQVVLKWY